MPSNTHIPDKIFIASPSSNYKDATVAFLLMFIVQIYLAFKLGVFNGTPSGLDGFMWLTRVLELHEHGNWFDHKLPRVNPPIGYEQHWTRPFDIVLISGAWLGSIVTEFRQSLYIWSILVSPVLEILALFSFLWLIIPVLGNKQNGVAGVLFVTQIGIMSSFLVGRADHQSLIFLFFILSLGMGLRLLFKPFTRKTCYLAASLAALAIWVSVESILFPIVTIFAFGLFWLFGEYGVTRKLAHYTTALFLLLILFRAIEFGHSRLLEPALDQISIVYITLFGLIAVYWVIVYGAELHFGSKTRPFIKLVSAAAWTLGIAVLLEFFYPGFFSGPWGGIDELFKRVHLSKINELKPLISLTVFHEGDWLDSLLTFSLWLGIIIPGIPILLYLILKSSSQVRLYWAFIGIHCLVYIPLSLNEVRFATYTVILMLPGYTWFIISLMQHLTERYEGQGASLMRVLVLFCGVIVFILPEVLLGEHEKTDEANSCPLIPISDYLRDPGTWGDKPRNLLAFTDFGPELLYRTPHSVFSIPSHRYHSGFTDSYLIMSAIDDNQALHRVVDRQVDLILICPNGSEKNYYSTKGNTGNFYKRISSNDAPAWLEQIKLPDHLADSFKLYRVNLPTKPSTNVQ